MMLTQIQSRCSQIQNIVTRLIHGAPLQSHPRPSLHLPLAPGNHKSVLHFYGFCYLKNVIQMESYSMQPFEIRCFTKHNSLKIHPSCWVYQQLVAFHCPVVFNGMDTLQFNYSPIEEHPDGFKIWDDNEQNYYT